MKTTIDKTRRGELAATVLRISLGSMFLAHSLILKYGVYTLAGTAAYFESVGLPGWLAYPVFWMEAVGGLLLVVGIGSRWVSLILMPILLGALWVHSGNGWVFTSTGGGWEYPLYLIVLSGVQILLGDGAFSLASARHSTDGRSLHGLPRSRAAGRLQS